MCIVGRGTNVHFATIAGSAGSFLPVTVGVSPSTINTACGGNKDQGDVTLTIFGSKEVDVTQINQSSLRLETTVAVGSCSAPTDVNADGFPDLTCKVPSCPALGPLLFAHENPDKTVDIQVTGQLNSGTKIAGDTFNKLSP
jgi:hypothetical protein